MYCKKICVRDFRNIEDQEVSFSGGVNVLYGNNAEGKTNLLEAIFYASLGKSFRAAHSTEIIRFGAESAEISLDYTDKDRTQNIKLQVYRDKRRRVEKNGVKIDKMSEIVGGFRSVLFCPEHLSLIKDGPAMRRNYLDVAISRIYPLYMKALQRYNYILKQRNALIKNAYLDRASFDATVEIWSDQLAREAAAISRYRVKYIKRTAQKMSECFSDMVGERETVALSYVGTAHTGEEEYLDTKVAAEKYFELLMSAHDREIAAGVTLFGVHKDDIEIKLNGKSARLYASQGQQRSLSLALKIAEGEICREEYGDYPVMLLDDVLSELDEGRRAYLMNELSGKQVIITSCEKIASDCARVIRVESGRYTEV